MDDEERRWLHTLYPELSVGEPLPAGSLGAIKLHFASEFARWMIHLPEDAVVARRPGRIQQAGWAIWYLFGMDEKGEYLDYYSAHRMTGDEHVRVYEDGSVVALEAKGFGITGDEPGGVRINRHLNLSDEE